MTKQDANGARTAQDLELKYNLAQLLGMKKNFEFFENSLTKINNELNNTINALLINLSGVLDTQTEVSLYYSEGKPTTSNFPANTWDNLEEHYGDLYYDQTTGYVYQFKENSTWKINDDVNLIQAMALTNIEVDTTEDKERKVFFNTPSPPYSSGDWWIKEDGTLYICQLGKTEGSYEERDFIISSKYTATIAVKENSTIKVLKGTLQEITEDYVKYTDLSTGGSTTIAGENVTTGVITSQNYIDNTSGMKIDLTNGTITAKNSKLDENGNWVLKNGATVISEKGLKNTYLEDKEGFIGFESNYGSTSSETFRAKTLDIEVVLPSNITITHATVIMIHFPVLWEEMIGGSTVDDPISYEYYWGSATNLKLYKAKSLEDRTIITSLSSDVYQSDSTEYEEISNAFGSSGFTANSASSTSHKSQQVESIDISSSLKSGLNKLRIKSADTVPTTVRVAEQKSGYIYALLRIEGYMSYDI